MHCPRIQPPTHQSTHRPLANKEVCEGYTIHKRPKRKNSFHMPWAYIQILKNLFAPSTSWTLFAWLHREIYSITRNGYLFFYHMNGIITKGDEWDIRSTLKAVVSHFHTNYIMFISRISSRLLKNIRKIFGRGGVFWKSIIVYFIILHYIILWEKVCCK